MFLSLKDQEAKVREELRSRHSEGRRVSIGGVTRERERHSLNQRDAFAKESRYVAVFPCISHRKDIITVRVLQV